MSHFSLHCRVRAPRGVVFDIAGDLPRADRFIPAIERIEMLTEPPVGVGTRWKETRRIMGRESTEELEMIEWDPPAGYTVRCDSCGACYTSTFRFQPVGPDTNVVLDTHCRGVTPVARILFPLTSLLFGRTMKKMLAADLDGLRQAAEKKTSDVI